MVNNYEIKRFKKDCYDIVTFWKEFQPNGIFSSWYNAEFILRTNKFINIEHWMAYRKAVIFNDNETRDKVLAATAPATINFLSRNVNNFVQEEWDKVKYNELEEGNYLKFRQNDCERFALYETNDALIMLASPYDKEFGMGMSENEIRKTSMTEIHNILKFGMSKGGADNLLGKALMAVRDRLKQDNFIDGIY